MARQSSRKNAKAPEGEAPRAGRPGAGPPGAPPAPLTFLHGDFAVATVGGATLNIFDWRVQFRTTLINTRAHGQRWAQRTPIESEWVFTGRGYITSGSAAHAVNAGFANEGADPPLLAVIGYSGGTGDTPIFAGEGYMTGGTLSAPDQAMAEQEFEITGHGTPTTGV